VNDEDGFTIVDFPQPEDRKKDFSDCSILFSEGNVLRFSDDYEPEHQEGEHLCARVSFTDSLEKIGWHKIHIETF